MRARRQLAVFLGGLTFLLALAASPAQADFGIKSFSVEAVNEDGTPATLAGSHPYEYTLSFELNQDSEGMPEGKLSEVIVDLPPGLLGNPQALPRCTRAQFDFNFTTTCPGNTQVGVGEIELNQGALHARTGIYNLTPTPGSPATLGLSIDNNNALLEPSIRSASDYGIRVSDLTIPTAHEIQAVSVHVWGLPMAPVHDAERLCIPADPELAMIQGCTSDAPPATFFTLPTSCNGPMKTTIRIASTQEPGVFREASALSLDENQEPVGLDGCNQLQFEPSISSQPTTNLSDSPTGLDFNLHQVTEADFEPQAGEGEHKPGQTEICQRGGWFNKPTDFAYRWLRNGVPIPGAESNQYVVQEEDEGKALQCEVSASNAGGTGHTVSAAAAVSPAPATPLPVATGKSELGAVINGDECRPGIWTGNPSFSYQWFLDGAPAPGETGPEYLAPLPSEYTLQCEVIGTNAGGSVVSFSKSVTTQSPPQPVLPDFAVSPGFGVARGGLPRATAPAKDVTVTLPEGMTLNPSAANGLGACSESQIGYLAGAAGVHFSESSQSCPDASKIGTLEVSSPLLDRKIKDGVNGARTAVYVAKPFENPFGSLLAIYLVVEDPLTGIVAKLAGKAEPDPNTGQLKTTFKQNPQLPIEDFSLHLYQGPRAALKTPLACGTHTTTSTLVPWSSPEGADAHPTSSFATSVAAGGGACPTSEAAAPNQPAFSAGTIAPVAGAYSPFVLKLTRQDGTQRLTGIDATLPKGLTGRLAGIPYCSEAQIAVAKSRETPNQGALEQSNPSCPLASEVGSVTVGAGAGISPLYVGGHAYLAGPYKGAPLSMAIITPAVAGPFDLGAVVVRTALQVNPETAQIHAVSDPLPSIIQGVPLNLRSVAVKLDRPSFTLNPTSCDPMAITGSALTLPGQSAALASPFQVGGCSALKFKPKLAISLKGATKRNRYPALKAVLTYPPGQNANIASAQVNLPHSEFLEQAHIGTICTRVQFAADQCPAASVYGFARAYSPLLDKPVEGPVYLRSSSHELPDLVAALRGQVDVDLVGRVDTGPNDGIRNTFEATPDVPVSKFVLEMKGGRKGLLVNSENICSKPQRAIVSYTAHNGAGYKVKPLIENSCKGKAKKKSKRRSAHK